MANLKRFYTKTEKTRKLKIQNQLQDLIVDQLTDDLQPIRKVTIPVIDSIQDLEQFYDSIFESLDWEAIQEKVECFLKDRKAFLKANNTEKISGIKHTRK